MLVYQGNRLVRRLEGKLGGVELELQRGLGKRRAEEREEGGFKRNGIVTLPPNCKTKLLKDVRYDVNESRTLRTSCCCTR